MRPTLVRSIGIAPMHERGERGRDPGAEEVVGGGADDDLVSPALGYRRQEQSACRRGCDGWRRTRPGRRFAVMRSRPCDRRRCEHVDSGRMHPLTRPAPRDAGDGGAGPLGVVVGPDVVRIRRVRPRPARSARATGTARPSELCRDQIGGHRQLTSAMRMGGLCRWVIVGVATDDVGGHLERVLQRRRGHETRDDARHVGRRRR